MVPLPAAALLVLLHRADGGEVLVSPAHVTALHAPAGQRNKLLTPQARCLVGLTDGKWLSVIEPCEAVRRLLEGSE